MEVAIELSAAELLMAKLSPETELSTEVELSTKVELSTEAMLSTPAAELPQQQS